jgi:hypothetical protein
MAVPTARPRQRPRILTASAMKMEPRDQESRRRRNQSWQKNALEYARMVPELNYASRFYSKMLSRIHIYPAMRDEREQLTPITDGLPVQLLERIQDPGGGRSTLLSQYGRLMFITGEGYLFGRNLDRDDERWSFVSMDELELLTDGNIRHRYQVNVTPIEYGPSEAVAYRLWTPSPEKSGEAESPMRAVELIAEELVALTKAVRATAVSRITQGILKVPSELSFGSEEPGVDDDPEENPFLADLIDHITGAVEGAGTAEAATPFLAEGATEYLSALEWMKMHDPQTDYMEQGLRKEAIERLAHGLDFPAEYLLSLGNVNHWSARAITHEMWRTHGAPLAEQFCDDMSEEYLRRALRDANYPDWRQVVVAYDDASVVVPVDRSDDADRAADHGMVSDQGYRQMKAIDESLAPSEVERRIYLAVKMRNPSFLKGTPFEIENPIPAAAPPGPVPTPEVPHPAEDGPPPPGPAGVSREESRAAALHGVAYSALHRCREVAGARIRQGLKTRARSRTVPELALLDGQKNAQVAAVLGQEKFNSCALEAPLNLVKGGADAFVALCMEWGFGETQASALGQTIEVFSARTLFESGLPAFPSGFFAQIARANEVSAEIGEEGTVRRNNEALAQLERMLPSMVFAKVS